MEVYTYILLDSLLPVTGFSHYVVPACAACISARDLTNGSTHIASITYKGVERGMKTKKRMRGGQKDIIREIGRKV